MHSRSEDICWVKTNRQHASKQPHLDSSAVLQHTKEHCLVGIKGSVKRNIDTHMIHANMDVDLIVDEERPQGQTDKPEEVCSSPFAYISPVSAGAWASEHPSLCCCLAQRALLDL